MARVTSIQWAHSTVNPTMGCDGCPLWPGPQAFVAELLGIMNGLGCRIERLVETREKIRGIWDDELIPSRVAHVAAFTREAFLMLAPDMPISAVIRAESELQLLLRCYAGQMTNRYAGHSKGYPKSFDQVERFPGRMAEAANWGPPSAGEREAKPWLDGCRRLVFVSDMSDSLSDSIPFSYLAQEVVATVSTTTGRRHTYLWLTKRPGRMVEFHHWLGKQGIEWPENLIPMASILNSAYARQAVQLLEIPAPAHGFSVEPLDAALVLPAELLAGKPWIILGGESGAAAHRRPFNLAWARAIRDQCLAAGAPIFMKQMGAAAYQDLTPLNLRDSHGGDWTEWPLDLRIRQVPMAFRQAA